VFPTSKTFIKRSPAEADATRNNAQCNAVKAIDTRISSMQGKYGSYATV